jgi:L-seryl-tRNA(Ser) seleniumtransferase
MTARRARPPYNLELDLLTGRRGERERPRRRGARRLTGAEAALVVNNNAAAVLLAHRRDRRRAQRSSSSRGELVEIGGSFRMPDVMALSGARLSSRWARTNRTHADDYRRALGRRPR